MPSTRPPFERRLGDGKAEKNMVRNSKKGEPDVLKLPGLFRWLISRMIDELNYLPPIGVCRGFCCCAEIKVISVHVSVEKEFPYEDFSEVWTCGANSLQCLQQ